MRKVLWFAGCVFWGLAVASEDLPSSTIGELDNGKSIVITLGARLSVRLPSQLGTGFGWQVVRSGGLVSIATKLESNREQIPGATDYQVFEFEAHRLTRETLLLEYRRPWEKDIPAQKLFRIEVNVKKTM